MHGGHKDGLPTDTVHIDTRGSLNVVQMDVAKLGDHIDDIVLGAHLQYREKVVTMYCKLASVHIMSSVFLKLHLRRQPHIV